MSEMPTNTPRQQHVFSVRMLWLAAGCASLVGSSSRPPSFLNQKFSTQHIWEIFYTVPEIKTHKQTAILINTAGGPCALKNYRHLPPLNFCAFNFDRSVKNSKPHYFSLQLWLRTKTYCCQRSMRTRRYFQNIQSSKHGSVKLSSSQYFKSCIWTSKHLVLFVWF